MIAHPVVRRLHWTRANGDKPHRCPRCHRIPDKARRHGGALWLSIYECSEEQMASYNRPSWPCNVRWWRGWHE